MNGIAALIAGMLASPMFADLIVSRGTLGVQHYTNDGVSLGTLVAPGTGGLTDARGVAVSPAGDLYVSDFANDDILKFAAGGLFLGVFASGSSVDTPLGLAFGTAGDLFLASAGATSNIARIDKTSGLVVSPSFTSGNMTPLGGPQYLTFGPDLAVTDIAGHLFHFDAITGTSISTGFFDNPVGVAFNAAGDLFLAQRISDNVLKIPAGGGPASIVIPNGAFAGSPADVAFGPNGLLYLAATSAIYRFDVSGANGVLVDSFGNGGKFLAFTPAVPEPGTWGLGVLSIVFLGCLLRRKH
ncbi:MAG TPA: PEP-CTERM sorting domain-containing protein [Bryobacteraceae bacterium]|jgi:DNA-binding beta-propeller fold protein YncE